MIAFIWILAVIIIFSGFLVISYLGKPTKPLVPPPIKWIPTEQEIIEQNFKKAWEVNYWKPGNHIYEHYMNSKKK